MFEAVTNWLHVTTITVGVLIYFNVAGFVDLIISFHFQKATSERGMKE